jgi:hypothetical protein
MPNPFKYSTSTPSNALRKGNVAVGVNNVEYGPTSTTGWYSGIDIPEGGYVVYTIGLNNNPKTWVAQDDNDLPAIARTLGGGDLTILESKIFLNAHANTWILSNIPPNIVTDGLVYYSDGGDMTSFMNNEPTTNVVADPLPTTGWSVAAGTQGSALTRTYLEEDGKPFMRFSGVTNGNDYPRVTNSVFANSATITGTFSTSLEVRGTAGAVLRFRIYENGSTKITNTITLTSEWTRYTFDNQTTGFNLNQPYFNPATSDAIYDIRNIQVEAKSHATPFTAGTRSQNTLLNDLSGESNNGTLTNGPTFNTNGWFDFDGVDDYINGQDSVPLGNPCTVMALINCNSGGSGAGVVFGSSANGSDNWFEINNTSVQLFATRIADTDNFTLSGGTLVCDGTRWYNIAMTIDGATAKIYLDGVEVNSVTQQFTIGDWTGTFDIGRRGKVSQRYFKGSISNVIGYNKSLSEDELRQNYYQAPIVTDGLVLAVDAGNLVSYESGSTTAYSLTGSLSGSLVNGTGYLPDNGGIWDFDGTNDQINFGNQSSLGFTNGVFSVEAWIYIPSSWTGGSQYPNLVSKGGSAGWDTDGWSLFGFRNYGSGTGYAVGIGLRNSGAVRITLSYNQPADTWLHVVGTLDGSSIKIYVNGILKTSNTQDVNPGNNNTNVYIGKTLTAAEVSQNYNAQSSRFI